MYVLRAAKVLVCAACVLFSHTLVKAQSGDESASLQAIHQALEQARFEQASELARKLLEQTKLSARARNDALELLAIVQIAQRNATGATQTLQALFARDPEHPRRVHDPGPAIDAAFARARKASAAAPEVTLSAMSRTDAYGRSWLEVQLEAGADRVESVHVFARSERDAEYTQLLATPSVDDRVTTLLPAATLGARAYRWYVEARAPSGLLLARIASAETPNETAYLLPPAPESLRCPARKSEPVTHRWWLWTSIGVMVAGAAITTAVVAQ